MGGGLGPRITACENFNGQLVKPEGMNRYFLLAGDQDGRINEILGLDSVKRLPGGSYVHRADDVQTATPALADYQAKLAKASTLEIARGRQSLDEAKGIARSSMTRATSPCARPMMCRTSTLTMTWAPV